MYFKTIQINKYVVYEVWCLIKNANAVYNNHNLLCLSRYQQGNEQKKIECGLQRWGANLYTNVVTRKGIVQQALQNSRGSTIEQN